ncbi:hypothetical protein JHL22_07575 [Advenella sp. WQ 585]|uniref:Uncharacterized protein n=1 Tax=Advenella mandrilli TaxID=2800330 RepID=A0ABS1EBW9_9BURK|nr:hypothetical protein [Advenella mandrilli]MBK1781074.1 hypothetical protein [Advenella mandrilli]
MDINKGIYLSDFDVLALRLKHELGIKQDYELAKFFGISAPSFNARKKTIIFQSRN